MAEYKRLDEVCLLNMGQSPNSKSYNTNRDGVPFFQGNADFGEMYPSVRMWCNEPTKIVEPGTLLISVRAPIGALNFAAETSCIGRGLAGVSPKEMVDIKYIYYCLKGKHTELNSKGTGSTFKAISKNALGETAVKIIPLKEQCKVVEALDAVSSIITARQQQLSALDTLIKARFVEMFGDMVANPNGWEKKLLGDACDVRDGTHDSPKYVMDGGYPLITSKNVSTGKIDFTDCNLICREDLDIINARSKVDLGDILMPMIGTVGNPVIVDDDREFAIKNVALIKFSEDSVVNNIFVKALLQSGYFDRAVLSKVRGGTQKFISLGDIRKLEIVLPPIELQMDFADFVNQVDKSKVVVQEQIDKLQMLFDSLMQQYFG